VEVAFLSNKEDELLILDPEFHKAVACQIVEGIKKWLKAVNDFPVEEAGQDGNFYR
jgi:N-acetylmuramoyl-L-alanine amidase